MMTDGGMGWARGGLDGWRYTRGGGNEVHRAHPQTRPSSTKKTHLLQGIQNIHLSSLLFDLSDLFSGNFVVRHGLFVYLVGVYLTLTLRVSGCNNAGS